MTLLFHSTGQGLQFKHPVKSKYFTEIEYRTGGTLEKLSLGRPRKKMERQH
jgi:hypothetical protein